MQIVIQNDEAQAAVGSLNDYIIIDAQFDRCSNVDSCETCPVGMLQCTLDLFNADD